MEKYSESGTAMGIGDSVRSAETRRRYFLQTMGVDLYMPRVDLPNAKASVLPEPLALAPGFKEQEFNEQEFKGRGAGQNTVQGVVTSNADKGDSNTPESPALNLAIDIQAKTAITKTAPTRAAPTLEQAGPPLRFQLSVWRVAQDILVLDTRDEELALPTDTLLRNMLAALGYSAQDIGKKDILRWPFAGNTFASNKGAVRNNPERDKEDARAMVRAFIEAQHQTVAFATVLLMGEAARFALPIDGQAKADLWQSRLVLENSQGLNCQGIVLPSLAELLKDPSLKKNTWHSIRHLCRNQA